MGVACDEFHQTFHPSIFLDLSPHLMVSPAGFFITLPSSEISGLIVTVFCSGVDNK